MRRALGPLHEQLRKLPRRLPCGNTDQSSTPAYNGLPRDFEYALLGTSDALYMIWPLFVDPLGLLLPSDDPLPIDSEIPARMFIVAGAAGNQTLLAFHRQRIREGIRFYCREGSRRVAEGRVTQVTGLAGNAIKARVRACTAPPGR
jgi:hypothetical protein